MSPVLYPPPTRPRQLAASEDLLLAQRPWPQLRTPLSLCCLLCNVYSCQYPTPEGVNIEGTPPEEAVPTRCAQKGILLSFQAFLPW